MGRKRSERSSMSSGLTFLSRLMGMKSWRNWTNRSWFSRISFKLMSLIVLIITGLLNDIYGFIMNGASIGGKESLNFGSDPESMMNRGTRTDKDDITTRIF
jgi:hypothetical protein